MNDLKEVLIGSIVCGIFFGGIVVFILPGYLDRQEIVECKSLVAQSKAGYDGKFFIAKWQDDQCRSHGIVIDAPVK